MKRAYLMLADGCEEIEALSVVDILRRGGAEVITVSVTGKSMIAGSHGIRFLADAVFRNSAEAQAADGETVFRFTDGDIVILPGGLKGTNALMAHEGVREVLETYRISGKMLAAICAAPSVLGRNNLLRGKKATCYPGFEDKLTGAEPVPEGVVRDGNIITGKSMAYSQKFALAVLAALEGEEAAGKVGNGICMPEER